MSDISFERSRRDLHDAKSCKYINICNSNVEISQIKGLNLTYYLQFFLKVYLQTSLLGSEHHTIYQNLQKIVLLIKSHIVGHLSITTFLV